MGTTVSISNIPKNLIRQYGNNIDYNILVSYIEEEKNKELEKKYYNTLEDNYGPFQGSQEALSFLTRKRG